MSIALSLRQVSLAQLMAEIRQVSKIRKGIYVTYSEPPFDEEVDHVLLEVIAVRKVEPVLDGATLHIIPAY